MTEGMAWCERLAAGELSSNPNGVFLKISLRVLAPDGFTISDTS